MRLTSILTTGGAAAASVVLLGGPALAQHITGTPGDDHLRGTYAHDTIHGKAGNDVLKGLGGPDSLFGQGGNDQLRGGSDSARDLLDGGRGADQLIDSTDATAAVRAFGLPTGLYEAWASRATS